MDWKEKMYLGMKLIHEACTEDLPRNCHGCPFDKICDTLVDAYWNDVSNIGAPDTWNINKGEKK